MMTLMPRAVCFMLHIMWYYNIMYNIMRVVSIPSKLTVKYIRTTRVSCSIGNIGIRFIDAFIIM